MRRKATSTTLFYILITVLLFTTISIFITRNFISSDSIKLPPIPPHNKPHLNLVIQENLSPHSRHVSSVKNSPEPASILLPDWEVLVVSSPENPLSLNLYSRNQYSCLFQNNASSPAEFTGILYADRSTFKCTVPASVRRLQPILKPILTESETVYPENRSEEIIRWSFLTYESLSTENDVILFVKGVNNRQGVDRSAEELKCVFDNGVSYAVKTSVTSSVQEVFRCHHPNETEISKLFRDGDEKVKVSLEIIAGNRRKLKVIVPSVTYYAPARNVDHEEGKSLLCACTMVHNVSKFLKEWIMYYSKLGVEKFVIYDNDSDDALERIMGELGEENYNIETIFWPWAKTQEGGFSHSAIYAKSSCKWMMYVDVDEFVFSPSWLKASIPSQGMLPSLLPKSQLSPSPSALMEHSSRPIGQVSIRCLVFGPSQQRTHPIAGVTQGYTCRQRLGERHKSILLLDAVDVSLHNAIHHFWLRDGYRTRTLSMGEGVVNHYKYQAWTEFEVKFKRRVSAYVVDWRNRVNPGSNDRTPGLGFEAIEPEDWGDRFCKVNDTRLKVATQRWFSLDPASVESKMLWQD